MIHAILRKQFPKSKVLRKSHVHFGFDVMERGYLMHWAMGVEPYMAIGLAMLITLISMTLFIDGDES